MNIYILVSTLNTFSKVYENIVQESFVEKDFSKFISAYKKTYGTNHVSLKLVGDWKDALDNKTFLGAVCIAVLYFYIRT